MKVALAPTAELAHPKVEKFVRNKLVPQIFGMHAVIQDIFMAEPSTGNVESRDGKERWIEANWGVKVLCDSFNTDDLHDTAIKSSSIDVNSASVRGANGLKILVEIWISARVMRH